MIEQLEVANAAPTDPENNPALLPPVELIQYILDKHHAYLRAEFPRIHAMSERVAKVHGGHTPALVEVFDVFCAMAEELNGHMMKEEHIFFPRSKLCVLEEDLHRHSHLENAVLFPQAMAMAKAG